MTRGTQEGPLPAWYDTRHLSVHSQRWCPERVPRSPATRTHIPAGMNAALVLGLVVGAHAGAVELTKDNFNELVIESGKGAIVKFQAPW